LVVKRYPMRAVGAFLFPFLLCSCLHRGSCDVGSGDETQDQGLMSFRQGSFKASLSGIQGDGVIAKFTQGNDLITWKKCIELLNSSDDFKTLLVNVMNSVPFKSYFWETIPFSDRTAGTIGFQFVCLNAPNLEGLQADCTSFGSAHGQIRVFPSLSRDAVLVVPPDRSADGKEVKKYASHSQISTFLRDVDSTERLRLFQELGRTLQVHVIDQAGNFSMLGPTVPVWVNTEGSGVPWLHLRIDTRPKYYHYDPFRSFT